MKKETKIELINELIKNDELFLWDSDGEIMLALKDKDEEPKGYHQDCLLDANCYGD